MTKAKRFRQSYFCICRHHFNLDNWQKIYRHMQRDKVFAHAVTRMQS